MIDPSLPPEATPSPRDRCRELIETIVEATLKGKIRAKAQVYQLLRDGVDPGSGEIFERVLSDRLQTLQNQIQTLKDELQLAKANRNLRALQTIQQEWERVQTEIWDQELIQAATQEIATAEAPQRLSAFLEVLDPNRTQPLNLQQLQQLGQALPAQAQALPAAAEELEQFAQGIQAGLEAWQRLEGHLVSWIYDQNRGQLGFGGIPGQQGPWALWAKQVSSPLPQTLFQTLALQQSPRHFSAQATAIALCGYVELAILLQYLQRGLVTWFDRMVYNSKLGARLSIATYLAFAILWSQLASGFSQNSGLNSTTQERWANACFQNSLQILRLFSQREYFPLYGGIFASFTGDYLRDALDYLDQPLRQVEGTQEKARILTLLGYSYQAQGRYTRAIAFHQQAAEIARQAGDRPCEIANWNHLSRTYAAQKRYDEAISTSQRALILSRQAGDRLGEANALTNLGYSEVFAAQAAATVDPDTYETAIHYLHQGLKLAEQTVDRQSQALCYSSLGIAQMVLDQPEAALPNLEAGWQAAQFSGDLYLQGLNLAYLAQAHHRLQNQEKAIATGALGMYLLEQIGAREWRQPAGLLTILQGQMGELRFSEILAKQRSLMVSVIGVDGYDHLKPLIQRYQDSMDQD